MNAQEIAESEGVELLGQFHDVVLCNKGSGYHPYVTWKFFEYHFYSGRYFSTLEEAEVDFKERIS